ncbi:MAG: hypothetical protein KAJ55_14350 [Anaerolineales bacterium]|nr:hypothetical protein [Anaerolineales bacterium]
MQSVARRIGLLAKVRRATPHYHKGRHLSTTKGDTIMAIDDVSRLTVVGRFQEQNIVNTFHYQHTAQVTDDDEILKDLIDAWDTALKAAWVLRCSDDYVLVGIKAFKQAGTPKVPAFKRLDEFGSIAGTPHSAFVSRVITLYTGSTNHRRRGRIQLSGGDIGHFNENDGSVLAAEVVLMQTLANALLATITSGSDEFNLCIPATDELPFEPIVAVRARNTPGIIRSRRS